MGCFNKSDKAIYYLNEYYNMKMKNYELLNIDNEIVNIKW